MSVDVVAAVIHVTIGNPLTALAQAAERRFEILRRDVCDRAIIGESLAHALVRIAPGALDDPVLALLAGVAFEFDIGGAFEEIGAARLDDNEPFSGGFPYSLNLHAIHTDANILVTFALGDYDLGLKDQTDETIVCDAVAMLRDIYGAAVPAPSAAIVTRWNNDPFGMCSNSFASPQTRRADSDAFREVVQMRLLFAGEHTTADQRGPARTSAALHMARI